jgi:trehalose 6-phosphate phosphatase
MSLLQSTTQSGKVALDRIRDMPDRAVCAFDFDGTLAPIVPDPRDSRAHPGAVPALRALAGRVRAVAVITGRPAQTAVDYGGLDAVPGITVLGHYGRERWEDGKLTVPEPPPGLKARGSRTRSTRWPCTRGVPPTRKPRWSCCALL